MRRRTLLTQVLWANLLLIVVATVAAALATNPDLDLREDAPAGLVLGLAVALTVAVNMLMLSRRFEPLERIVDQMEHADLSHPGANVRPANGSGSAEEVKRLQAAFGRMLERLEAERRRASSAALHAQERERARVARDLHDEVNQALTGLLLRLEAVRSQAPPALAAQIAETKTLANDAMRELGALARHLRPTALDDLGLEAALDGLVRELGGSGVRTNFEAGGDLGSVEEDVQLVVYRIAQEALSNALRHSGAGRIRVRLSCEGSRLELAVLDDGRGFCFEQGTGDGLGIPGMRERALLVGGELRIESRPGLGTRVRLGAPCAS